MVGYQSIEALREEETRQGAPEAKCSSITWVDDAKGMVVLMHGLLSIKFYSSMPLNQQISHIRLVAKHLLL